MMISQATLDHLEIIMWSVLIAAGFGAVVFTLVGTLTYLLTRGSAHHVPAVVPATPKPERTPDRQPADLPVAVAG